MRINNNLPAKRTFNALESTGKALRKTMQRLSTGLRINSAADDAAGLSISQKMRAQIGGLDTAIRNTQDGVSLLQTAEGALSSTQSILQRMRELAVQAANDSLTSSDRAYIQQEIGELKDEINRIANTTQFNGKRLLDGSVGALWASDDLSTRAIVRGGLTSVDQFGQKVSAEGNYKIEITATPGMAQVQKSGIFTAKAGRETEEIQESVIGVVTETKEIKYIEWEEVKVTETKMEEYHINLDVNGEAKPSVTGADNQTELDEGWNYVSTTKTLEITGNGIYHIVGTSVATKNHIKVAAGLTDVKIFLENANIDVSGIPNACAFEMSAGSTANVYLIGNSSLKSASSRAGMEVPEGATLILNSAEGGGKTDGKLTVEGGYQAAGIGASGNATTNFKAGEMIFNGGTLDVKGGTDAAGIGGGYNQGDNGGGKITINGGDLTVVSPLDAGIGTGLLGGGTANTNGDTEITITGGRVKTKGGGGAGAGIGGGLGFWSGTIKIRKGITLYEEPNLNNQMSETEFRSQAKKYDASGPEHFIYAVAGRYDTVPIGHGAGSTQDTVVIKEDDSISEPTFSDNEKPPFIKEAKETHITWVPHEKTKTETVTHLAEKTRPVTVEKPIEDALSKVTLAKDKGAQDVSASNLPAGSYTVKTATPEGPLAILTGSYGINGDVSSLLDIQLGGALQNLDNNASILFEVTGIEGGSVTLKATANLLNPDGTSKKHVVQENIVLADGATPTGLCMNLRNVGIEAEAEYPAATMALKAGAVDAFSVGDKFVYNFTAKSPSAAPNNAKMVEISGKQGGENTADLKFGVTAPMLAGKDVHFSSFYLDSNDGTVSEGEIVLSVSADINDADHNTVLATFDATLLDLEADRFVAANGDTQLKEVKSFYNSEGVFMLQSPQTITVTQGDGRSASVTLYANDTIADLRAKLNDALANGLGQIKYANDNIDNLVTFVEEGKELNHGLETVPGTFIVRSLIPGKNGELAFSGDEDLLNALGLNTIQESSESQFTVSVFDAHSGAAVATNVKTTSNMINTIIPPSVGLEFDPLAGINAAWNELEKAYTLSSGEKYTTTLHLSDSAMTLQVGANRGEDFLIDLGDMSARALGIEGVNVTTRERAARSIGMLDRAITRVSEQRAKIGAYQNSLEYTAEDLTATMTNLTEAESRIRDADMAQEMMEFVKLQILNQSGTSMLAQANQLPQQVLSLFQG